MRVVDFGGGKFGVMRRNWFGRKEYLSPQTGWWWHQPDAVYQFCRMKKHDAEMIVKIGNGEWQEADNG